MNKLTISPLSKNAQAEPAEVPKCDPPLQAGDIITIEGLGMQKNGKLTTRKNAHTKQVALIVKKSQVLK